MTVVLGARRTSVTGNAKSSPRIFCSHLLGGKNPAGDHRSIAVQTAIRLEDKKPAKKSKYDRAGHREVYELLELLAELQGPLGSGFGASSP